MECHGSGTIDLPFKDQAEMAPSVTRTVMVADLLSMIELIGENSVKHPKNSFVDPGAQAWDELDGNLTDRIRMNVIWT